MMSNTFTTSAQKTLSLPPNVILDKLEDAMTKETGLLFEPTKNENIKEAKNKDGSKLIIAAFIKDDGKTLAMLDLKNIPGIKKRDEIQQQLKAKLNELFK